MKEVKFDRFRNWLDDKQDMEFRVFATCNGCLEPIYEGEEWERVDFEYVHSDLLCVIRAKEYLQESE